MKNIDGCVTKDSLYRLLSNMRMNREIDDNASSKVAQAVADMKPVDAQLVKHARWEHHAGMNSKCTYCGNYFPVAEFEKKDRLT